ncbi:hypothetical protein ACFOTA_04825 [Chitinophaga sp. GCM10012297]|nr:hypothetical protein [Chitinophaga chungangae]
MKPVFNSDNKLVAGAAVSIVACLFLYGCGTSSARPETQHTKH